MKEVENMLVKTRFFGEVDIDDEKILTFDNGIIGFEDMKHWTVIYDIISKRISYEQYLREQVKEEKPAKPSFWSRFK